MEMTLPESKVLEKFNDVSTAKRLANMVSLLQGHVFIWLISCTRNCMIRTLADVKKSIKSRDQKGGPRPSDILSS